MTSSTHGVMNKNGFRQNRKCVLCRYELPREFERLACDQGCDHSICTKLECQARIFEGAKAELVPESLSIADLAYEVANADSLLVREAAADQLKQLGSSVASADA